MTLHSNPTHISVCLPTYNGEAFVRAAIESVLKQTHQNFELIVCDDGSTDATSQLVEVMAENDKRIVLFRNAERLGLFRNYNKCLEKAQGELIKPFAQDDILLETALSEMSEAFAQNKDVQLVCVRRDSNSLYAADAKDKIETALPAGRVSGKTAVLESLRSYRNLIGEPVAVMCNARVKANPFDPDYHSLGDLDCWLRLLEHGDLFVIDKPLVQFRQHENSATMSMMKNLDWVLDFYKLSRQYERYLTELGITRDEYCMRFTELAGSLVDQMVQSGKLEMKKLDGFREVAFYSMRRAAQLASKSREYDSVVASTSWRITKPLRQIIAMLGSR